MIRLLKYFRWYYWLLAILVIGVTVAQVLADLEIIEYLEMISNHITDYSNQDILEIGGKMLFLTVLSVVFTVIASYISARIAAGFSHDVRKAMYQKVQNFSMEEIEQFSTASLITRSTNDVTQVQMVIVMILRTAVQAPVTVVLAFLKMANSSKELNSILYIAVGGLLALFSILFIFGIPRFKVIQKLTDKMNLVTRENLTGLRVVRAYGAQEVEKNKFSAVNQELSQNYTFVNRLFSLMGPGMSLVMNMTTLTIMWVGVALVASAKITEPGIVISFQQFSMKIVIAFMHLTMIAVMIPRGSVSGARINGVLRTKTKITDPKEPVDLNHISEQGSVEFKHVSFSYPGADEPVLCDISFSAKKGETVAFIGSTGSGKSTLINLVPRFFDVTEGEVLVDGINVKDYQQKDLRDKIGYVPQKGILYSGTIASNLKYGKEDATEEEIWEALEIAQAKDFVLEKENTIHSLVAQGGTNVSGGQKQRLSIARAVIKKPEIYIFDDSFSALDFKTDKILRGELKRKIFGATNLIVAQRVGTIMDADQIIVLEHGKIVGTGTHKELLKTCDIYREIALSQLSKEELEDE